MKKFLVAHGAGSFSLGIHIVLLAWISVSYLNVSATGLAWVQAAALAPNMVFILLAGVWADRFHTPSVLALSHVVLILSYILLAAMIASDSLNYIGLLCYGAVVGSAKAVIQPVREKLLLSVSEVSVQKRISLSSIVQFTLQSAGILLASLSDTLGLVVLIVIQAFAAFIALISLMALRRDKSQSTVSASCPQDTATGKTSMWREFTMGVRVVKNERALSHLLSLVGFNGFMHMGVFFVVLPILARESYGFVASQYAFLQFVFVAGMVVAHWRLLRQDTIRHPGQGALFSLLYTALIGFSLSKGPTLFGLYAIIFIWGFVAGNSAGHCRLILQSLVEAALKGRVMSIYQFTLFGLAPVGAITAGYAITIYSLATIFSIMSISSAVLFMLFLFSRNLWRVEQPATVHEE